MDFNNLCMGCMTDKGNAEVCPKCGYVQGTPPASPQHLPPWTILRGRYLLGRVLGYGGFGVTYLAFDMHLNIKLAIKEYLPREYATRMPDKATVSAYSSECSKSFEYGMEKFLEEARILAQFDEHPNIVSVKDFFKENGTAYFVMNYIEGMTFKEYCDSKGGKIPYDEALKLMTPVMDALKEIHGKGLLHRDISPDNIYITSSGKIKLLDFGAARYAMGEHSKSMSVILKPGYAPEEQYRARGNQGPWTDVYAAGATLYRAITGQVPPESLDRIAGEVLIPPSQLGIAIPPHIESAIMKALSLHMDYRYKTIDEFMGALLKANNLYNEKVHEVHTINEQLLKTSIERVPDTANQHSLPENKEVNIHNSKANSSANDQGYKAGTSVQNPPAMAKPSKPAGRKSVFMYAIPAAVIILIAVLWGGIYLIKSLLPFKTVSSPGDITIPTVTPTGQDTGTVSMDSEQYMNVNLFGSEIETIDPSTTYYSDSLYILQETMEGLAREEVVDGKNLIVPAGAENWDVSSDNLTWTFHLRGVKWSDGVEVTAKDYEYGIKRTLDMQTASAYSYILVDAGIKGAADFNSGKIPADQVGVSAIDNMTLQIVLDKPCPYFEKLLALRCILPQRQDIVEKLGDKYGLINDMLSADVMVCNGPFKIAGYEAGKGLELVKNDQYWDKDKVNLNKINVKLVDTEDTAANLLENNEIDIADFSREDLLEKLNTSGKFDLAKSNSPSLSYLEFNTQDKYFKNPKIRRAFTLALDREDLVKNIGMNMHKALYGWIPYSIQLGNSEYRESVPDYLKNAGESPRSLLIEGMNEIGEDNPSTMTVTIIKTKSNSEEIGDYLKSTFESVLGINVTIEYLSFGDLYSRKYDGNFQIICSQWIGDFDDPIDMLRIWETNSGFRESNWSNDRFDQLIERARTSVDNSERLQALSEAEKLLVLDDCAAVPLYSYTSNFIVGKYVKNVMLPLFAWGPELKYAYTSGRQQ